MTTAIYCRASPALLAPVTRGKLERCSSVPPPVTRPRGQLFPSCTMTFRLDDQGVDCRSSLFQDILPNSCANCVRTLTEVFWPCSVLSRDTHGTALFTPRSVSKGAQKFLCDCWQCLGMDRGRSEQCCRQMCSLRLRKGRRSWVRPPSP